MVFDSCAQKKARRTLASCGLWLYSQITLRLHSRVGFHYNFRRVVLSVYRQLHVVSSRFNNGAEIEEAAEATSTTATAATAATKSGRQVGGTLRCLAAQVPLNAIDTDVFRSHEGADHLAGI